MTEPISDPPARQDGFTRQDTGHPPDQHVLDRPFALAQRVTGVAAIGTVLTGALLLFFYHPDNRLLPVAHVVMVALAVQGIVASSVLTAVRTRHPADSLRTLVTPGLLLVLAVGAWVIALGTGLLLGWDQLALEAVTVGDQYQGFGWVLDDDIEFVVVGSSIIEVSGILRTLIVHLVAAAVSAVAGIVLPLRLARRTQTR